MTRKKPDWNEVLREFNKRKAQRQKEDELAKKLPPRHMVLEWCGSRLVCVHQEPIGGGYE